MKPFSQPAGVVDVQLDKVTNLLGDAGLSGDLHRGFHRRHRTDPDLRPADWGEGFLLPHAWFGRRQRLCRLRRLARLANRTPAPPTRMRKKKKGFFGKIAGIFKDDKPSNPPPIRRQRTGNRAAVKEHYLR